LVLLLSKTRVHDGVTARAKDPEAAAPIIPAKIESHATLEREIGLA
jgi:hypothetical protein